MEDEAAERERRGRQKGGPFSEPEESRQEHKGKQGHGKKIVLFSTYSLVLSNHFCSSQPLYDSGPHFVVVFQLAKLFADLSTIADLPLPTTPQVSTHTSTGFAKSENVSTVMSTFTTRCQ